MATAGQHALVPLIVRNQTRNACLVEHGRVAASFWTRLRGLLGTSSLPAGDGLLIEHCSSIHSIGMRYPFDALFLDRSGRVIHSISAMKPNRVSRHLFSAHWVLELPAGTIRSTATERGDQLRWTTL